MMDLLKPPTDNLYKFQAVGGIALIVAGLIFPILFFLQTGMEYLVQLRDRDEFKVLETFTKERLKTLKDREQQAIREKNELEQRLNQLVSASRVSGNSGEIEKLESRIKETNRQIESIADASHEASLNLGLKQAQVNNAGTVSFNRRRDSRYLLVVGLVVIGIGLYYLFIGFRRWGKRLQQFQDIIVEKEAKDALQAKTEASNEVPPAVKSTQVEVTEPTR